MLNRKILILIVAIMPLIGYAQDTIHYTIVEEKMVYEKIYQADSSTKTQLYNNAKLWVAKTFKSAKDVIQLDDPESGKLITKGNVTLYTKSMGVSIENPLWFTLEFACKDGKYRVRFTDLKVDAAGNKYPLEKYQSTKSGMKIINQSTQEINDLFSSIDLGKKVDDDF